MKKFIIWDLFGGGQNSVYHTVQEFNLPFDVFTFDITEPQHNNQFKMDLAQDNIIECFKHYPKPDIIVASPLCQSFSVAISLPGGGTCFWKKENNKLVERNIDEFNNLKQFNKRMSKWKDDVMLSRKRLGEKCINNTLALIDYYKPKLWWIENPKSSLMWYYLKNNKGINQFYNSTNYSDYGFLAKKPTTFLSNVKLDFKKQKYFKPKLITENNKKYLLFKNGEKIEWIDDKSEMLERLNKYSSSTYQENKKQSANDKSNFQIKEAGAVSAIPHKLLADILTQFLQYLIYWKEII